MTQEIKAKFVKKCRNVRQLYNTTPTGAIVDADTILADIIENVDPEETGVAYEIIEMIEKSEHSDELCRLFEVLLGVSFEEYLDRCIVKTTH